MKAFEPSKWFESVSEWCVHVIKKMEMGMDGENDFPVQSYLMNKSLYCIKCEMFSCKFIHAQGPNYKQTTKTCLYYMFLYA